MILIVLYLSPYVCHVTLSCVKERYAGFRDPCFMFHVIVIVKFMVYVLFHVRFEFMFGFKVLDLHYNVNKQFSSILSSSAPFKLAL